MRFDLFSSGRLYRALKESGYADLPAERTLREWIKNNSAPVHARIAVEALLGQKEEAAPRVEERLDQIERWLRAIAATAGVEPQEVADLELRVDELARARQQHDAPRLTVDPPVRDE